MWDSLAYRCMAFTNGRKEMERGSRTTAFAKAGATGTERTANGSKEKDILGGKTPP